MPSGASPQLMLTIALSINNTKFGTAVPSDFTVTVNGPAPAISFSPAEASATIAVSAGVNYSVTVAGPGGFDVARSPDCSGLSIVGQKSCQLTLKEAAVSCDDTLWSPVYLRDRLNVLDPCQVASGIVADEGLEPDGDLVMELIPDSPYTGLLRAGNRANPDAHNHLIVEVPCQGPSTEAAPKAACAQFTGVKVPLPPLGSHIVAAAHWVEDRNHSSWGELHGARILLLPR